MKATFLTKAVDQFVDFELMIIEKLIDELIEPLEAIGSPEKLIGKKYVDWNPMDFQQLSLIYGTKEPNPLSETILKNELKKVQAAEAEVM